MSDDKVLKKREEIKEEFKWKLNKVYASLEDWEKDFEKLKKESIKLKDFQGKLSDKDKILEYLKLNEEISRLAEKLYVYAHMKSDEDTTNQKNQGIMNKVDAFMAELGSYTAFFVPEILSLKEGFIEELIREDERFKLYEFY